jgi:hypothetical protein
MKTSIKEIKMSRNMSELPHQSLLAIYIFLKNSLKRNPKTSSFSNIEMKIHLIFKTKFMRNSSRK